MSNNFSVSVILLAGGTGQRMGSPLPKQFLKLSGKEIARYSFDCFTMIPEVSEIVVVCEEQYRHLFDCEMPDITLRFALPGKRRQDSVYNGFQAVDGTADLVCVHDSARPFITPQIIRNVLLAAYEHGAAVVGMPAKNTIKEVDDDCMVINTPDRSRLWEIQTPQVLYPQYLRDGFRKALENNLTVTDDVSLAELIQKPVKLVLGDYRNIKITTPEDITIAEKILESHEEIAPLLAPMRL